MARYNKTLIAILSVVLTALNVAFGTNPWVQMVIGVAVVLGVYTVPNRVNSKS